ncbi:Tumor protein D53 [Acipenser ruthenus]|uniref:Tumor protein D53 n=1 Tax=Acipenser ruthenus TaxID=7906 RepID=A0A444UCH4_ACIRT|nr:Tumor protein D53 [Acipenser ruthenus]
MQKEILGQEKTTFKESMDRVVAGLLMQAVAPPVRGGHLEEEISTLRQVLTAKEKHHAELKQKLGVNPLSEFRQNFNKSWHEMQTSTAYKKTQETFSTAGQKASAAFSNVGTAIGRKFGDMRNSSSFKSFEEKVESTVSTLKSKVGVPSNSGGSFEEVLSSAAHASAQDTPAAATRLTESSEQQC